MGPLAKLRSKVFPHSGIIIDIPWPTLLGRGVASLLYPASARNKLRFQVQSLLAKIVPSQTFVLPGVSVRSLFDLYLRAKAFPPGSQVIVSAINIAAMEEIINAHGLQAVAWDIDRDTLAPRYELLAKLVTPRTRAILVSALFGKTHDLRAIAAYARHHGLALIEDHAEGLFDPSDLKDLAGDLKLYSLGLIKNHTALGGGFALLRHASDQAAMAKIQADYPCQKRREDLSRLAKAFLLSCLLNTRWAVGGMLMLARTKRFAGLDAQMQNFLRAYPSRLLERIRRQPSSALLSMMQAAIDRIALANSHPNKAHGDRLTANLAPAFSMPGRRAYKVNYWLFPILVAQRQRLAAELRAHGVHCFMKNSLVLIGTELDAAPAETARRILDEALFLPFNSRLDTAAIDRLSEVVLCAGRVVASMAPEPVPEDDHATATNGRLQLG